MRYCPKTVVLILLLLGGFFSAGARHANDFRLQSLAGNWEGEGEVLIPKTSIPISIEGKAKFTYDSLTARLRTEIQASKFLFTYADSGYIYHDTATDSISWDVWDGFGKYSRYRGTVANNVITGVKTRHGYRYRIKIDFITDDSLNFTLTTTGKDGDSSTRAAITMWRSEAK
jgi:hypothetical protein